jgi:hypothetical protein
MKSAFLSSAITSIALVLTAPAAAQSEDQLANSTPEELAKMTEDERAIIVKAQRKRREAVIQGFADTITRDPRIDKPLERWRGDLCPVVYGLKQQYGAVLKRRFIANLDGTGLHASDDPECRPNVLIGVVKDVDAEVRKLEREQETAFGSLLSYQIDRAVKERGPVRSWNTTEVLSDRGQSLEDTQSSGFGAAALNTIGRNEFENVTVNQNTTAARLNNQISVATRGAVVLIDIEALDGKSLNQLADYATMRALVPTRGVDDPAAGPTDTILSLFADDYGPKELTVFDRNFLKAYYGGAATLRPRQIYGRIGSKVVDAEEGQEAHIDHLS